MKKTVRQDTVKAAAQVSATRTQDAKIAVKTGIKAGMQHGG